MVCSAVNDERDASKAAAVTAAAAVALSTASPALAISARLEGTETARLIEEAQVSKKKPAAAPAKAAVKTAPVPKTAAPGAQYPKPGNAKAENADLRLPEVKLAVPEPTKAAKPAPVTKATVKAPKPAVGKPSAPVIPKKATAPKPAAVKPAATAVNPPAKPNAPMPNAPMPNAAMSNAPMPNAPMPNAPMPTAASVATRANGADMAMAIKQMARDTAQSLSNEAPTEQTQPGSPAAPWPKPQPVPGNVAALPQRSQSAPAKVASAFASARERALSYPGGSSISNQDVVTSVLASLTPQP